MAKKDFFQKEGQRLSSKYIVAPLDSGYSDIMTVSGREGRFNFNEEPQEGGTPGKRYRFETTSGELFNFQLEREYQGGRWEDATHAESDYDNYKELYKESPYTFGDELDFMWGNSDVGDVIYTSLMNDIPFSDVKKSLAPLNTFRQISSGRSFKDKDESGQSVFLEDDNYSLFPENIINKKSDKIYAAGKYQVIPETLKLAIKNKIVSEDDVYSKETQEKLADWLILKKAGGGLVGKYFSDDKDTTSVEAAEALAKEWASISMSTGVGYYDHDGVNRSSIKHEDILKSVESKDIDQIKKLITKGESNVSKNPYSVYHQGVSGGKIVGSSDNPWDIESMSIGEILSYSENEFSN